MPEANPFADLIPGQAPADPALANPFADLIPEVPGSGTADADPDPFADLIPKVDAPIPSSTRTRGSLVSRQAESPKPAAGPSLAGSIFKGVPRGALDIGATSLEPFALGYRQLRTMTAPFIAGAQGARDLSDDEYKGLLRNIAGSDLGRSLKSKLMINAREVRAGRRRPDQVRVFMFNENLAEKAATGIREFGESTFPIPPEHEQRLPVQVARGVGGAGAFLATRLLPGGQFLLPGMAGLAGGGEAIERAAAAGASDEDQARTVLLGTVAGLTDIVPIERLLRPIANVPGVKGALYGIAKKAVEQGLIEGTQEGVQQFMQNAIARLHTSDQDLAAGIREGGLVGFLVGTLFGGGAGGVQAARPSAPAPAPLEPSLSPAEPEVSPEPSPAPPAPEPVFREHIVREATGAQPAPVRAEVARWPVPELPPTTPEPTPEPPVAEPTPEPAPLRRLLWAPRRERQQGHPG